MSARRSQARKSALAEACRGAKRANRVFDFVTATLSNAAESALCAIAKLRVVVRATGAASCRTASCHLRSQTGWPCNPSFRERPSRSVLAEHDIELTASDSSKVENVPPLHLPAARTSCTTRVSTAHSRSRLAPIYGYAPGEQGEHSSGATLLRAIGVIALPNRKQCNGRCLPLAPPRRSEPA